MEKIIKFVFIVFILYSLSSCKKKIPIVKYEYLNKISTNNKIQFKISDFDIYAFNICEKSKKEVYNTERFCECPNNFFEINQKDSIKKIEETYLFINTKTNLVFYLTTFSHKHIWQNNGFLNNRCLYKDKMYVLDLEYIYIGTQDTVAKKIEFKNPCKDKGEDMIWHYSKNKDTISINKVNIATAENKYTITKPICLDTVFSNKIRFKKVDYKLYNETNDNLAIKTFYAISKKGRIEILFKLETRSEEYSRIKVKRVPYHMGYKEINEIQKK